MTKKKDTTPEPQAVKAPTVKVLGPDGPVYLTPEPIYFVNGEAELSPELAAIIIEDKAAPGRYKLAPQG